MIQGLTNRATVPKIPIHGSLSKGVSMSRQVPSVYIEPEIRAGGTINREFKVNFSDKGVSVDVSA